MEKYRIVTLEDKDDNYEISVQTELNPNLNIIGNYSVEKILIGYINLKNTKEWNKAIEVAQKMVIGLNPPTPINIPKIKSCFIKELEGLKTQLEFNIKHIEQDQNDLKNKFFGEIRFMNTLKVYWGFKSILRNQIHYIENSINELCEI
jgi:hypothetical protein